jgi:FixJ family two-component response regulator
LRPTAAIEAANLEPFCNASATSITTLTSEIPDAPPRRLSGIVVDINLRSAESVLRVRDKLCTEAYRSVPRLFVLADALHHGSMQAWALGATDTISRPFDAQVILQRIRSAFPNDDTVKRRRPERLSIEALPRLIPCW